MNQFDQSTYYGEYYHYLTISSHTRLWLKDKIKSVFFISKEKMYIEVLSTVGSILSITNFFFGSFIFTGDAALSWRYNCLGSISLCIPLMYWGKILRRRADDRKKYLDFLHTELAHSLRSFQSHCKNKKMSSDEIQIEIKTLIEKLHNTLVVLFRSHDFQLCIKYVFHGKLLSIRAGKDSTLRRKEPEEVDNHFIFKRVCTLHDYDPCVYFPDINCLKNSKDEGENNFFTNKAGQYQTIMAFPINQTTKYGITRNLEQHEITIGFLGIDSKTIGLFGNLNDNITHTIGCFVDFMFLMIRELQEVSEKENKKEET